MGYSWGGMAALFDAALDKRVRALISLDGSFRMLHWSINGKGE
jgi:pimeloyl-ACP methyl ester carboxylesterase